MGKGEQRGGREGKNGLVGEKCWGRGWMTDNEDTETRDIESRDTEMRGKESRDKGQGIITGQKM